MFKTTFIGLDVHAKTVTAAALNADTGEIDQATMPADNPTVISWVQGHGNDTAVTYEAGPTGYGLARDLTDQGISCTVAAPSKLLRAPADRVKINVMPWPWQGCCRWARSPRSGSHRLSKKACEMSPARGNALSATSPMPGSGSTR